MEKKSPLDRQNIPNVILVGSTGSGKSTVGLELARVMKFGFLDLDQLIEKKAGQPIHEIFKNEGEVRFRDLESDIIKGIGSIRNHVVVTGAGALERSENVETLKAIGPIVWVATPTSEIARRLVMQPEELRRRPLLAEAANIEDRSERSKFLICKLDEMMERRHALYEQADLSVTFTFATPATCAQFIRVSLLTTNDG